MPKFNKKFKRRTDETMETLYDLEKMSEREVVWPSPKTPEVSSVVQFIIDNSAPARHFLNSSHANVLLPSGFVKEEEVLSRDSNNSGEYTVLGVSPSITPSLACEVLITENSQNNEKKHHTVMTSIESSTQQNCLREIDLSMNHNHNHLNGDHALMKPKLIPKEEELEEEEEIDYDEELSESELNIDETEAMKELGYCIHRMSTDFKLFSDKENVVKCCSCGEIIGKVHRKVSSVMKLEFSCNYCEMLFHLIGDLNMHLINHYHEIETGHSVICYDT